MAIALDSVGTGLDTSLGGTLTFTHTITSNSNGILVVLASAATSSNTFNATPTFAGQNMTQVIIGSAPLQVLSLLYLLNPPTGLGTFNGTWSGSSTGNKSGISLAYTGVNQSVPIVGSTSANGFPVTSGSIARTITANNLFVGGVAINHQLGTTAIGNERGTASSITAEGIGADSQGTLQWTFTSSSFAAVGAELGLAGVSTLGKRTLLGAGI